LVFILNKELITNIGLNIIDLQKNIAALKKITTASVILTLITSPVLTVHRILTSDAEEIYSSTWGCGYLAMNGKIQACVIYGMIFILTIFIGTVLII
jgi:hypothetical protein